MPKTFAAALLFLLFGFTGTSVVAAPSAPQGSASAPNFLSIGAQTRAPVGWVQFCRERPWECRSQLQQPVDVSLTETRWNELNEVNRTVNAEIAPATDMEMYGRVEVWTYPVDRRGDCEDYALLKRARLIERGWPESALLLTVVRDRQGDGHAVLMVRTAAGDVVLDNVADTILPWHRTGYRFVKRQSQWAPNVWVSLPDDAGADVPVAARR